MGAHDQFMIVKEAVETAGCVTYWRASGSVSIQALEAAWKAAGLDEKLLRKPPGAETACRRAVLDQASRRHVSNTVEERTLVRPHKEPNAWTIMRETATKGAPLTYTALADVHFQNGLPHVVNANASFDEFTRIHDSVHAGFTSQQGMFDPSDVTGWLVKLAKGQNSVTLRDSGGVYFIPQPAMDFWNKAAAVIQGVSSHVVLRIPAMKNDEAIAAITDAVNEEAKQIAAAMDEELALEGDDKLGSRALKGRAETAQKLLDKISSYEKLLGTQMAIRQRIEDLSANLAIAAMAAPEKAA